MVEKRGKTVTSNLQPRPEKRHSHSVHLLRLILLAVSLGLSLVPAQAIAAKGASSEKSSSRSEAAQVLQSETVADEVATTNLSPFGEVIRATGPMSKVNPFTFSTRYYDWETELLMYLERPYSPRLGRWLSRDPIGEEGGLNLYAFVGNNPINLFDPFGMTGTVADTEAGTSGAATIESGGGSQATTFLRNIRQWADEFNEFQQIASDVMDVLDGGDDLLIAVLEASNQNAAKARGGESAAARLGRAAHDLYNPGPDYNIKTKAWLNGGKLKPDAIDFVRGIVRELKPFSKSGVRQGRAQIKKYLNYLNENFKREGGWKGFVDYY